MWYSLAISLIPLASLEFNDLSEIFSKRFFFRPILPDRLLIFFDNLQFTPVNA